MTTIHNHLLPLKTWTVEDSNVMTKLRLKRLKTIPTSIEIRRNLGPRLADAVFSNICPTTKHKIGLGKELHGPGDELWSQPQRQLLGELILEPYPTRRHRQALTHQAILEYGSKCMEDWESNVSAQKERELQEKIKEVVAEMNKVMETRIDQVRTHEREDFLIRIAMMEERIESRHQVEMEALTRKLIEEKDAKIAEVMETLNKCHKEETEALLDASKKLLTNRFHFKINWIKADLEEDYNNKLMAETKLIEMKLRKKMNTSNGADFEAMKNQLFQNVVCTACLTADYLLKEFHQKIDNLKKERTDFHECNMILVNEIEHLQRQNELISNEMKSWECVLKEVIKHFQKFIEFQLRLPKGEATHLISWDKVVEKKNDILNELIKGGKSSKHEVGKKKIVKKVEEQISLGSTELCANKDIISIISSIIRRVIPSVSDLGDAEEEIAGILEHIIKQVVPSISSLLVTDGNQAPNALALGFEDKYCPKFHRKTGNIKEKLADQKEKEHEETVETSFTNSNNLDERILEITNIMHQHPNVMKFIQGP